MNEKRYVVILKGGGTSLEEARGRLGQGNAIYELGPEVVDPNYEPLAEWARVNGQHGTRCGLPGDRCCHCGLTEALKAAGIE